jgi:selenocysteine-specific elongation factor
MIIIGTAGHIDHGKTTLIGALTGTQTDRLKEEQERGISIELGFAYLDLPSGIRCGVVDVPGHERFVRQMIAGATGIDLVLLVVAADEGVMQQTREHLDICRLLGIKRGMVVLTKTDLVDPEWLELVESDAQDFVAGTFLEDSPILRFSSKSAQAIDDARQAIEKLAQQCQVSHEERIGQNRPLRLPIDRVFSMQGFGTVVTGTITSGQLRVGDAVSILPTGRRSKVRGIQSHGKAIDLVHAGQRAAINLQGLEKSHIHRGNILCHPDGIQTTRMLDVDLHVLSHIPAPITSQAKALVHVGTSHVTGTIVLLEGDEILPGESALVQLRLDQFVMALGGERIILRGFDHMPSYGKTIGGGTVLHPLPTKHRRRQQNVLESLHILKERDLLKMTERAVHLAGHVGLTLVDANQILCASPQPPEQTLQELVKNQVLQTYVEDGVRRYVHTDFFGIMLERAKATVTSYHQQYPFRPGVPREELRSQIRQGLSPRYFVLLLETLAEEGAHVITEQHVRSEAFAPSLSAAQDSLRKTLLKYYQSAGLEPESTSDVVADIASAENARKQDIKEILDLMIADGSIVRVQESLLFAAEHVKTMEENVVSYLEKHGEITTPKLKELTGTSRKFTVPLGEYLDAKRITIRINDVRKLRG